MKSVLFVIDGLGIGGSENHLVSLLNVFDYKRYKVDLLMYRRNGSLEQFLSKEVNILPVPEFFEKPFKTKGIKIKYLLARFKFGIGRRINTLKRRPLHHSQIFWKYYNKLFGTLPKKYDFAVAFNQGFSCFYVAEKVLAEVKLLSVNTDLKADGYREDFDIKYFDEYKYILPVTETLKQILLKSYGHLLEKMYVFGNTFNTGFMMNLAQREKAFTDDFDGTRIVSIGRYVPAKGWDLSIKAANILKEHKVKFKWYLVGYGHLEEQLSKLIESFDLKETVILTGKQINPYKYLKEADLYVQTSRYEGFCRTLKEAKVFHLPLVTTNFSVVHEQITNGVNGLIVDMDENAIAEGIENLLANHGLCTSFIENIRKEPVPTNKEEFEKFEKFLV